MAQTRPTGDQIRFQSSKTGEHVLDDYMEAVERGTRTLPNLLDDLWAPGDGQLRTNLWNLRVNPTTFALEQRIGDYASPDAGWNPVANASFFNFRGAYADATAYLRLDLVIHNDEFFICTNPHTSSGASPSGTNFKPLVTLTGAGVNTFNGRSGTVLLSSADVTSALGYTPTSPATLASTVSPLAPINSPTFTGTPVLPAGTFLRKQLPDANAEGGEIVFEKSNTGLTGGNVSIDLQGGAIRIFDNASPPVRRFEFNLVTGDIWNSTKNANVSYVGHTHTISDITNLQTTLDGKSNTDHTHTYLPLTGGTITGNLTITKAAPTITLDGANPLLQLRGNNTTTTTALEWWGNMSGTSALQGYIATNTGARTLQFGSDAFTFFTIAGTQLGSITPSGLTILGRNVLADIDGKAATSHTHTIANVTGLQAALDAKPNLTGATFSAAIAVSASGNNVTISGDGAIEITRATANGGGPYIDFKDNTGEDFDVRLQANGTTLAVGASAMTVGGTQVSLVGHTHSIGDITNLSTELNDRLRSNVDQWIGSTEGQSRFFFSPNGTTFYRSGNGHEWRNAADGITMQLSGIGELTVNGNTHFLVGTAPTLWWRDTNHRAFAIHVNDDLAYFMRGGTNNPSWDAAGQINGRWPMVLSLNTADLTIAGNLEAQDVRARASFVVGDDAVLGDINISNTVCVRGQQNADRGYINFSTTGGNSLGAINGGPLTWNGNTVWHSANFDPATKLNTNNPSATGNMTVAGSISAEGIEVGYRDIPLTNNLISGTTATVDMRGKGYYASQPITIPANVFAKGNVLSIIATNSGSVSVVQGSGLTLRLAASSLTGNRTIAANGIATIVFVSPTEAIISGPGVS